MDRPRSLALTIVLALTLAACAPAAPAGQARQTPPEQLLTSMTIAAAAAPSHLDRHIYSGTVGLIAQLLDYNVTETLLKIEPDGSTAPLLAQRWETVSPGTERYQLRTGVTFSDGSPWNAEIAKLNFDRMMALPGGNWANEFSTVKKVEVKGEYVIEVTHDPDPLMPKRFGIVAQMYSGKQIREAQDAIKRGPIGTGPYRITSFDPAQGLVLEARDGYWGADGGGKPALGTVTIQFRAEPGTRTAMLRSGQADLVLDLLPDDARGLEQSQVTRSEGFATHWLRFGLKDPVTSDVRVRQAIDLAIDRSALTAVYGGFADAAAGYQLWPSWVPGWTKQPVLTPDVQRAKALIQQAGAVGKEITVVVGTGRWPLSGELIEAAAAMIEKTGLKVNMRKVSQDEYRVVLRDVANPREIVWSTMQFDVGVLTENLPQRLGCRSTSSQSTYCNPDFDTIAKSIDAEADAQKRAALVQQLTGILQKDLPAIGLVTPQVLYGKNAKLTFQPIPGGLLALLSFKLVK